MPRVEHDKGGGQRRGPEDKACGQLPRDSWLRRRVVPRGCQVEGRGAKEVLVLHVGGVVRTAGGGPGGSGHTGGWAAGGVPAALALSGQGQRTMVAGGAAARAWGSGEVPCTLGLRAASRIGSGSLGAHEVPPGPLPLPCVVPGPGSWMGPDPGPVCHGNLRAAGSGLSCGGLSSAHRAGSRLSPEQPGFGFLPRRKLVVLTKRLGQFLAYKKPKTKPNHQGRHTAALFRVAGGRVGPAVL